MAKENANNIMLTLKSRHKAVSESNHRQAYVHVRKMSQEIHYHVNSTKYLCMREPWVTPALNVLMSQMFYIISMYYFNRAMLFTLAPLKKK